MSLFLFSRTLLRSAGSASSKLVASSSRVISLFAGFLFAGCNFSPELPVDSAAFGVQDTSISAIRGKSITQKVNASGETQGLTYSVYKGPSKGEVVMDSSSGQYVYTAFENSAGPDQFSVRVRDGKGNERLTTIFVFVGVSATTPFTRDIFISALREDRDDFNVVLPFRHPQGKIPQSCNVYSIENLQTNQCTCNIRNCTFKVQGLKDYFGDASFEFTLSVDGEETYVVGDDGQLKNRARARVQITPENDAPLISLDPIPLVQSDVPTSNSRTGDSITEDSTNTLSFFIADVDNTLACTSEFLSVSYDTDVFQSFFQWSGVAPNCTLSYKPKPDFNGSSVAPSSIEVTLTDPDGEIASLSLDGMTVTALADDEVSYTWDFGTPGDFTAGPGIGNRGGYAVLLGDGVEDYSFSGQGLGAAIGGAGINLGSANGCSAFGGNCAEFETQANPVGLAHPATLVAYYKFDGSSADSSGNSLDGIDSNVVPDPVNGKKVGAYGVNFVTDTAHVEIPGAVLPASSSFTIMAWFKISGTGERVIFSSFDGSTAGGLELKAASDNGGDYKLRLFLKGSSAPNTLDQFGTKTTNDGNWHMVAFSKSGSNFDVYLDGEIDISTTLSSPTITTNPSAVYLGARPSSPVTDGLLGYLDEVSIWQGSMTGAKVKGIYNRQRSAISGVFRSDVLNAGGSKDWATFGWNTDRPYYKELPANRLSEDPFDYPAIRQDFMVNNLGYWNLNGDVQNDSGLSPLSGVSGGGVTSGAEGILNQSLVFPSGGGGFARTDGDSSVFSFDGGEFSMGAWIKPTESGEMTIFSKGDQTTGTNYTFLIDTLNGILKFQYTDTASQTHVLTSNSFTLTLNEWHYVGLFGAFGNSVSFGFYIDGTPYLISSFRASWTEGNGTTAPQTNSDELFIGSQSQGTSGLVGEIDEAAIWREILSGADFDALMARAATRVLLQYRTCSDSTCSSDPPWVGPGSGEYSFYSELESGPVSTSPAFSTSAPNSQYFQYQVFMESDFNRSDLRPRFERFFAHTATPFSTSSLVVNDGFEFLTLEPTITAETGECPGGVELSLEHPTLGQLYYNGGWVSAGANDRNSLVDVNSNIASAPWILTSADEMKLKVFLNPAGNTNCQLKSITVEGKK